MFSKPQPVPFATKEAIGQEQDHSEKQGILRKVDHNHWATPIVAILKQDGKFILSVDYKVTINQTLSVDQYPSPKPEDLSSTFTNSKKLSELELSQAYQQLLFDEASNPYVTMNTHQACTSIPGYHLE